MAFSFQSARLRPSLRLRLFPALILPAVVLFTSCVNTDDEICREDGHWEYEGEVSPKQWATCFEDCGGTAQSPVNLAGAVADAALEPLAQSYEEVPIHLTHNGHTLEFEYESGSHLTLDDKTYDLLQFHVHTGSEHTVDGVQHPMEVHLVHKHVESGQLAVVGVFVKEGASNAFLSHFDGHLPDSEGKSFTSEEKVNVHDLLPESGAYFTYQGSLTTPPCSEIATWFVMKTPVEATAAQIGAYHAIIGDNFRPVQPLNGRVIRTTN